MQKATVKHSRKEVGFCSAQLNQPLLSDCLKNKADWCAKMAKTHRASDWFAKRVHQFEQPGAAEALNLWIAKAMNDGIAISGEIIRQKYCEFEELARRQRSRI